MIEGKEEIKGEKWDEVEGESGRQERKYIGSQRKKIMDAGWKKGRLKKTKKK